MLRRDFLKDIGGLAAATALESCIPAFKGDSIKTEDLQNHERFLREDEHILPDKVFDAYVKTVSCSCSEMSNTPVGGYNSRNYLDTEKEKAEFRTRLLTSGFSIKQVKTYEQILTTPDTIIFRESILTSKEPAFAEALPHERFHREMEHLSEREKKILHKAYENIIHTEYTPEEAEENNISISRWELKMWKNLPEEARSEEAGIPLCADRQGGKVCMYARKNWKEFYPYLAQGEFLPRVEKVLENENPEAYEIYSRIKENCELKQQ